MRVGVCDFPSAYAFPPYGYGSIERWLWAVAAGAVQAGAEVWLLGPQWRADLPGGARRLDVRLEDAGRGDPAVGRLAAMQFDLLVVGHEYPSRPAWRRTWQRIGCDVVTFQHDPAFQHAEDAFHGRRSRLFCYSAEMAERYAQHRPQRTVSVQFGRGEETPGPARGGTDLLWLGRIHADKAPHLAAVAAGVVGRRLRIAGPVLDRAYLREHWATLNAPHVDMVGEIAGQAKVDALRDASTLVYTCSRRYVEAGAAVFGEALRCGTPVAALVWRPGTCADAALCERTGAVAMLSPAASDEDAAAALAEAIGRTAGLPADDVQEVGLVRFDPVEHFRTLARRP